MTVPMLMTDCPTEETLAAFIDDMVDDTTRRKVTEHVANCGECRELVLMAIDFQAEEPVPVPVPFEARRWYLPAAGLAAAVFAGFVGWPMLFGPDFGDVLEASQKLTKVHFEARLAGGFPHMKYLSPKRGGDGQNSEPESDAVPAALLDIAANDARFGDPHVRGVALLLGTNEPKYADQAIGLLTEAYEKASPGDERDTIALNRAAALLDRDRWGSTDKEKTPAEADEEKRNRDQLALDLSSDVWRRKHTPEAAWNRALALDELDRKADAIKAWDDYLKLDSSSAWAKDAEEKRNKLIDEMKP